MSKNTFHLVSLGCAKNTVDSDSMAQLLLRDGYRAMDDPDKAAVLIVNTCGFIGPAKEESYQCAGGTCPSKTQGTGTDRGGLSHPALWRGSCAESPRH